MLYSKYIRSMATGSQSNTATQLVSAAGETAKVRCEHEVGGDTADLMVLIDKIKRQKMSPDFTIVPATYVRNGKVYNSERPGAILFYSYDNTPFGELVPNGYYTLEKGARAGQTVERYKIVRPHLYDVVDKLFKLERDKFDCLPWDVKTPYLLGTLCAPNKFTPAVVDLTTGKLKGVEADAPVDDDALVQKLIDNLDNIGDDTPEGPGADDEGAPF